VDDDYIQMPIRRDLVDDVIVFQAQLIQSQRHASSDAQSASAQQGDGSSLDVLARYRALPSHTRRVHDYLIERAGQWIPLQELQDFSGKSIRGMFSGMSRRLNHRFGTTNWIIEWRPGDSGHTEYRITAEYAEIIKAGLREDI
jgi:hypothetical protein